MTAIHNDTPRLMKYSRRIPEVWDRLRWEVHCMRRWSGIVLTRHASKGIETALEGMGTR